MLRARIKTSLRHNVAAFLQGSVWLPRSVLWSTTQSLRLRQDGGKFHDGKNRGLCASHCCLNLVAGDPEASVMCRRSSSGPAEMQQVDRLRQDIQKAASPYLHNRNTKPWKNNLYISMCICHGPVPSYRAISCAMLCCWS